MNHSPDTYATGAAETAITLMLMLARRANQSHQPVAPGTGNGWSQPASTCRQLSGKTLGIGGFDDAAHETAVRARFGFGMKIIVHHRSPLPAETLSRLDATQVSDIDQLLGQADVVSLHCRADTDTRHLIDALRLNRMKPDAIVINTASSQLLDEEALADALWYDTIAGAGLQARDDEPPLNERLLACENTMVLPRTNDLTGQDSKPANHPALAGLPEFGGIGALFERVA